ncbi:MAG: outer membrane protein assembly factor BamD [Planctomycetes bacterium]|nr:outer membrane protein assembly factor BamD [Planctomycetota bacterium]
MRRRRTPLPLAATLLVAAACSSTAAPPPDADRLLGEAEALIAGGAHEQALAVLEPLADEACPKRLRDRRDVATATAHVGRGELWQGFEALERFSDRYPHSELRPVVMELLWTIGHTLATSGRGFWIFWSDRRSGRTVLEHLITRHPDTQRLADALRLLGDMAYEDRNYELAQERFRDLIRRRPESEWVKYACYRFAMSLVDSLHGPDYDLDKMNHAVRELTDFLATAPENPEILAQARAALARLREWRAERHFGIASFYRRVGNETGERHHLDIATRAEFEGTAAYAEAVRRREELGAAATGARP